MNCRLGNLIALMLVTALARAAAGEEVPVRIAGHQGTAEVLRQDGEILLHLTPLLSHLGAVATYNAVDDSLTLTRDGLPSLQVRTGSLEARVGDDTKLLAHAPLVEEGKSYFPIYSLARLLGWYVREDESGVLVINPAITQIDVVKDTVATPQTPVADAAAIAPTVIPPPPDTPTPPVDTSPVAETDASTLPIVVTTNIAPEVAAPTVAQPTQPNQHKLVLQAGAPVNYVVKTLSDPFRVYVDLEHANLIGGSGDRYRGGGDLLAVRASQFSYNPDSVRVVAEFASEVPFRVETQSPSSRLEITFNAMARPDVRLLSVGVEELSPSISRVKLVCDGFSAYEQSVLRAPSRVVLDLANTDCTGILPPDVSGHRLLSAVRLENLAEPAGTTRVVVELKQMTAMTVGRTSARELAVDLVTSPLSKKVVVVDAGHGGKDPGAQYGDATEKDLVLDMAKRLHSRLVKEKVTALMTRSDDTFVSLSDRCEFANRARADLFVSVHLNACARPNRSSGTEVYYYTEKSLPFAIAVHDSMTKALKLKDGGIRKHMLYVCHHTNMPSVLTETCYLNNDAEYKLATNAAFRQRAADAMFSAIRAYVEGPLSVEPAPQPEPVTGQPEVATDATVSTVTPAKDGE